MKNPKKLKVLSRILFSFILLSLLLINCGLGIFDSDKESPYFPLTVGNTWVFSDPWSDCTYTETITGTKKINGIKYYVFETSKGIKYLRNDGRNQIIRYLENDKVEIILYKLEAKEGTEWSLPESSHPGLINKLIKRDKTVTVPAGTFENCLVFDLEIGWADYGFAHTLTKGVGRIKIDEIGIYGVRSYELLYAEINGEKIGSAEIEK